MSTEKLSHTKSSSLSTGRGTFSGRTASAWLGDSEGAPLQVGISGSLSGCSEPVADGLDAMFSGPFSLRF